MTIRRAIVVAAWVTATVAATTGPATLSASAAELPELPATEPAPTLLSVGEYKWNNLGGNTGTGAKAFADQLRPSGYRTSLYTDGRPVADVFEELPTHSISFLHGHGAPGQIDTRDSSDPNTAILGTIPPTTTWDIAPPPHIRELDDYLPASEIDDSLLLIFSACETAETSDVWGNLLDVAASKGVDSVVGMRGKPLIPHMDSTTPMSYGNYFWNRAAYYLKSSNTLSQSLNKAVQDLIAREGSASGWQRYVIAGAATSPGSTRVIPARAGTTTVPGIGVLPERPEELRAQTSQVDIVDGNEVVDAITADGVSYRTDADTGQLLALSGEALAFGPVRLTEDDAAEAARVFAMGQLGPGGRITSMGSDRYGVLRNSVATTVIMKARDAENVANVLLVEVDRRSGRVTTFVRGHAAAPATGQTAISREDAVRVAQQTEPSGTVLGASLLEWSATPEWVVRLEVPVEDGSWAMRREVRVDAESGAVTSEGVAHRDETVRP